jgi:2-desacetyl-2-hydroxyethyl bacteriochlorophyllide A dehydrogenase
MKALCIIHSAINKVELAATEVRSPGPGEVLIETEYSLISPGTELRCLAGKEPGQSPFPFIPGYALAGRIIEVGPNTTVKPGTRVVLSNTTHSEGFARQWGGHISYAVNSESAVIALPDNVSTIQALAARLAAIPFHGMRVSQPKPGERVAVIGLGVIGLASAKLHSLQGTQLLAVDRSAARVEHARAWGIEAVATAEPASIAIRKRFPDGVDILIDATGVPAVVPDAITAMRDLAWDEADASPARYIIQGSYSDGVTIPYRPAFFGEVSVHFPRAAQQRDSRAMVEQIAAGKLDLSPLIGAIRSPSEAPAAYAALTDSQTAPLTIAFKWTKSIY